MLFCLRFGCGNVIVQYLFYYVTVFFDVMQIDIISCRVHFLDFRIVLLRFILLSYSTAFIACFAGHDPKTEHVPYQQVGGSSPS